MENKENIEAFIDMVNENNRRQREKEIQKEEQVKEKTSLMSRFKKRGTGVKILALAVIAAITIGAAASHIHNVNSYDPSSYYKTHTQISEAISQKDTTTIEFLKEQGYDVSERDEKYLKDSRIVSYLNKIHDDEGPDYEQVKNQFGDIVNTNLDEIKSYLKQAVDLPESAKINISYETGKEQEKDNIRITYYNGNDEGILLVSDDVKNVIERTVEAQNFAMEKGEGAEGNTTVLNNSIAGVLELDDNNQDMRVVRAIDQEFQEHHK